MEKISKCKNRQKHTLETTFWTEISYIESEDDRMNPEIRMVALISN